MPTTPHDWDPDAPTRIAPPPIVPPPEGSATDTPDGSDWYVSQNEQPLGPLTFEQLRAVAESGSLRASTLVWRIGDDEGWKPAGTHRRIREMLDGISVPSGQAPPPLPVESPPASTLTSTLDARQSSNSLLKRVLIVAGLLLPIGVGTGWWVWHNYVDTPDRAVHRLQQAIRNGRMDEARTLVSPDAWPVAEPSPSAALAKRLSSEALAADPIPWTETADAGHPLSLTWQLPLSVPEFSAEQKIVVDRVDGDWKVIAAPTERDEALDGVAQTIAAMRATAQAHDGSGFLSHAIPGDGTCTAATCPRVRTLIDSGATHLFVESVNMDGMVPGSLSLQIDDDQVSMRWLRSTRHLDQSGMMAMELRRADGEWKVSKVDATHFAAMDDELELWTENHSEMLWREEISSIVEVRELPSFCASVNYWGNCSERVHPTFIKNVSPHLITSLKISKNQSGRYFSGAQNTLWGVYRNVRPGESRDAVDEASPPVQSRPNLAGKPFSFIRVEWVNIEGQERKVFTPKDYRDVKDESLTFELVRNTRAAAGGKTQRIDELRAQMIDAGYALPELPPLPGATQPQVGTTAADAGE
jgi:hypothetical protein